MMKNKRNREGRQYLDLEMRMIRKITRNKGKGLTDGPKEKCLVLTERSINNLKINFLRSNINLVAQILAGRNL
jgi:hypothetical protein